MFVLSHGRGQSAKTVLVLTIILLGLALKPAFARSQKLVVLGDSLSAGYRLPRGDGFPEQLQWRLRKDGYDVKVINAGVSGDTTAAGLARLAWSVPKGTKAVIVELGANDALRGVDPAQTRKNLEKIIKRLKARKIRVLLAGMEAPRNMGALYVKEFGKIYGDLARKYRVALYPFFLKEVAMQRRLLQKDGLHPTREGVAVIVRNIFPHVERLIQKNR